MATAIRQLRDRINAAFARVSRPSPKAAVYDLRMSDCSDMMAAFGDRTWAAIPQATLFEWREGLFYFSAAGFRYYLPAFLCAALEPDEAENKWDFLDSLLATLAPDRRGGDEAIATFTQLVADFDDTQRRAVRAFLTAVREDVDAKRFAALNADGHWFRSG